MVEEEEVVVEEGAEEAEEETEEAEEAEEEAAEEEEEGKGEGEEEEALESAATPRASAADHTQLVQLLEVHMAAHRLSQKQMASAAGLTCQSRLSLWLGRHTTASLPAATMVETDAQIAAYLDGAPIPPAPTSTACNAERTPCRHCGKLCSVNGNGLEQHEAICARRSDPDVSAASAAEHAQLVQRLEEHMAVHGLSQVQVGMAVNLSSTGKLCLWLGRTTNSLAAGTMVEMDAQIAAYLDGAPIPPAAALAVSAAPHASSAEHAQLVRRLYEHIAAHDLTQLQVASAANISSGGKLWQWLGRASSQSMATPTTVDTDARIAAYLDGAPIPPAPTSAISPAPTSAAAPHVSSAEHAQLVQRLKEHMATHGLSQVHVIKAANLASSASSGILSMWLGRSRDRLSATTETEVDARIAAYLDGREIPQGPLKRPYATLPAPPPKQRARQNQWTRGKDKRRRNQWTPVLTFVRGGDRHTVDQSGGCSPEEEEGEEYSEYTAELLPIAADWPTARFPPAAPPVCDCGSACVWLRRRWFCAHDEGGCCFESEAHPEPAPLTPLCHCSDARPCKWLLGRWWCVGHPHGGCGFEHTPTSPAKPTLVAAAHSGGSRAVGSIGAEIEMARGCAAMLTASAFGLENPNSNPAPAPAPDPDPNPDPNPNPNPNPNYDPDPNQVGGLVLRCAVRLRARPLCPQRAGKRAADLRVRRAAPAAAGHRPRRMCALPPPPAPPPLPPPLPPPPPRSSPSCEARSPAPPPSGEIARTTSAPTTTTRTRTTSCLRR